MGRQPSNTRIGVKRIHPVRCRGGLIKQRGLRLEHGTFSWGSECNCIFFHGASKVIFRSPAISRKCRILDVVYNASNNELVRTKTLVKGAIIQVDATPFRQWYQTHYGLELGKKKATEEKAAKVSRNVEQKRAKRAASRVIDNAVQEQFKSGRLLAKISSRPGQSGRCDGYVLEGRELDFYSKKMNKKKGGKEK